DANDSFTLSFFPEEYKKALGVLGTLSGRDGDKIAPSGLTPTAMGESVSYEEAELSFLCRKLYQHRFAKEDLAPEIQAYYQAHPKVYPPDEEGEWQPHWVFVGEVVDVIDRR
ncbi:MAG: flavin reductase, partial [Oscillospiraceae bacterium]|nr:flavin reductase [Oscillospiraceae bacterium]